MRFVNSDDHSRSLIPLPAASLALARPEGGRVLSEMLSDTLALARGEPLRKIGEYEWCEPDYRQILLWAEALALEPVEVIRRLLDSESVYFQTYGEDWKPTTSSWGEETAFRNGRIVNLNWTLDLLPLDNFRWVAGMEIEYFRVAPSETTPGALPPFHLALPKLQKLCWSLMDVEQLDLSQVPKLVELECAYNELTELDLSKVPILAAISCAENRLTELDLSNLPLLTSLDCMENKLTELDLSAVPKLRVLWSNQNHLTNLILSPLPMLEKLGCVDNQIADLDLSTVPALQSLYCERNQLTKLDLSKVLALKHLDCSGNCIDQLDIRLLHHLETLAFDADRTRLIQRPDQHFQ